MRIATYNVQRCRGMDGKTSVSRIADVICEFRPDVIGLQEVLSIEGGPREAHQAQYLADKLSMNLAIGEVSRMSGGIYGNIVLSRYPLQSICTFDLSMPGRERRGCVRTDVDIEGQILHLFNFHLGTGFMERRWQARRLVELEVVRTRDLTGPRVVLGDFNEWTFGLLTRTLMAEFRGADLRLHLKRKTYPGLLPFMHLDHIYYDVDLVLQHVMLHRTRRALIASDHLPLYADFAIKGQSVRAQQEETPQSAR